MFPSRQPSKDAEDRMRDQEMIRVQKRAAEAIRESAQAARAANRASRILGAFVVVAAVAAVPGAFQAARDLGWLGPMRDGFVGLVLANVGLAVWIVEKMASSHGCWNSAPSSRARRLAPGAVRRCRATLP